MGNPEEMRRRLERMEAEIRNKASDAANEMASSTEMVSKKKNKKKKGFLTFLTKKFDKLATAGKVGVIAVGILVSLALLGVVFKLVIAGVTVAFLLALGYFGYKVFLAED